MSRRRLFLASQSPRRQDILKKVGIPFTSIPNLLDVEAPRPETISCADWVCELAKQKVEASVASYDGLVIGSDTMVVLEDRDFGKPSTKEEAVSFLMELSGKTHQVMTSLVAFDTHQDEWFQDYESVDVTFNSLTIERCVHYIESFEIMDKAGAYGVQHESADIVHGISGSYWAVMGLPLTILCRLLVKYDILSI